ncbi:acyltransferase [Aquimarina litoralis]|uniref:acyltransferase n=1 Tax=Aquimarina litoralis TaxID=584605 RepID=UPI001C56AC12|nr:hypothetical protein [Aquimarina litoralis]MBW1293899.1 hypothetical protein [Aquimarina litoralis]
MKNITTLLISIIPINKLKIYMYNKIFGFNISYESKLGYFNIFKVNKFVVQKSTIGNFNLIQADKVILKEGAWINKFNRIKNCNKLILKEKAIIFSWNFIAGIPMNSTHKGLVFERQNLTLGKTSEILRSNYVDLTNEITIGDNVVFAGNGSELWTHGFDTKRNYQSGSIVLGNNIFIGSNCTFTKNVSVCDNVTIGPSSVIYKSINEEGVYSSQKLYKVK